MNIEFPEHDRKQVADALTRVLADTYVLQLKTQGFHWNVTGPHFHMFHKLFEEIYEDLSNAVDELAERIRALGSLAPATFLEYLAVSAIKENHAKLDAFEMVNHLCADLELLTRRSHEVHDNAESVKDIVTQDLMIQRMDSYMKFAWMLRSHTE